MAEIVPEALVNNLLDDQDGDESDTLPSKPVKELGLKVEDGDFSKNSDLSGLTKEEDKALKSSEEVDAKRDDEKSATDNSHLDITDLIADNIDEKPKLSKKEKKAQKKQEKKTKKPEKDSKEKQLLESFNELTRKYQELAQKTN